MEAEIKIYDITGRVICALPIPHPQSSVTNVIWDAKGLSAGVYFAKLVAGDYKETKKLILVR